MTNPLVVMDPQISLKQYIRAVGLTEPGPHVLIDEDTTVRHIARELGLDLPPEALYLEQLWLRADPETITSPDEGSGEGETPAWVPANAKIHIDLVGGTPQGRAWVDGTGEVAVDTLLGSDPNTENWWGSTFYSGGSLTVDGYVENHAVAFIGAARPLLIAGATGRIQIKQLIETLPGFYFEYMSAGGNASIDCSLSSSDSFSADGRTGEFHLFIDAVYSGAVGPLSAVGFTVTPTRGEFAVNGSAAVSDDTAPEYAVEGEPLVAVLLDLSADTTALQSVTIYDPLPSTAGLSALSAVT